MDVGLSLVRLSTLLKFDMTKGVQGCSLAESTDPLNAKIQEREQNENQDGETGAWELASDWL